MSDDMEDLDTDDEQDGFTFYQPEGEAVEFKILGSGLAVPFQHTAEVAGDPRAPECGHLYCYIQWVAQRQVAAEWQRQADEFQRQAEMN